MPETIAERAGGCVHHPERTPLGRCASCRRPVCGECHIRLDGILHCRECLGVAEQSLRLEGPRVAPRIGTALVALALLVPTLLTAVVVLRGFGLTAGRIARLGAVAFEDATAVDGDVR